MTSRPLRYLGEGDSGPLDISEEDRESHIHILGAIGEGKSKLLELLLRQDIDNGYGACLLDPSDNGDTAYKVLSYAISKGYEKVVLIDPHDIRVYHKVPTINPLHPKAPAPAVVGSLMEAIRVLWDQTSYAETPRIQRFLPALLTALHSSGFTLAEARYFMAPKFVNQREKILSRLGEISLDKANLEEAFKTRLTFEQFQSTVNRLAPFFDPTMELMFGSVTGMDFLKMVRDKYLILVNLDPEGVFGHEHQRLLGTIIINEIVYAISRLRANGWKGVYYLYIDEVGDYATSKLSYILDKKRKSGLRLAVAHQRFEHLNKDVASAIYGGTKIKVMFNTPSREDRDKMVRMMYGGDLSDREVSYALSQMKKQHAVIKINKRAPTITRLPDIPDIEIDKRVMKSFKEKIYNAHAFYQDPEKVRAEISARFANSRTTQPRRRDNLAPQTPSDTRLSGSRKGNDTRPASKANSVKQRAATDSEESGQVRQAEGVQISWQLLPDDPSSKPDGKRRPRKEESGDNPQGVKGKP